MKENLMRGPLLKGGVVLLIFALLVYITSTSAEGSVWSSIATMVITAFRLVQWAIGMVIGFVVCLAVLFAIFLGAVAMVNREASANMYAGLKVSVVKLFQAMIAGLGGMKSSDQEQVSAAPAGLVQEQAEAVVDSGNAEPVNDTLEARLAELTDRIQELENKMAAFASHQKLEEVATEVSASGHAVSKLHDLVAGLEAKVEHASGKIKEFSSDAILGDLPHRIKSIEEKNVAVKEDIAPVVDLVEKMQAELKETIEGLARDEAKTGEGSFDDHRLFSYFEDPADQEKLESLVSETLKKDMTYAQVTNYLVKEMGKEKGQIITDHPSLAKDYIRQRRRS